MAWEQGHTHETTGSDVLKQDWERDIMQPPGADRILDLLRENGETMRTRFGVQRIGIFGSAARDEAQKGSDVDVLVDLESATFDAYMGLKFFLEDLLDQPVDLVLRDALKPRIRPYVYKEVRYAEGLSAIPG